jgi:hypothetical protein
VSRITGAPAIAEAMSVSKRTVHSWCSRGNSPIPIYRTVDGRLWTSTELVSAYWGNSALAASPEDSAVEQAVAEAFERFTQNRKQGEFTQGTRRGTLEGEAHGQG